MLWDVSWSLFRAIASSGQKLFQTVWKESAKKAKIYQKKPSQTNADVNKKGLQSCQFVCSNAS